MKKNINLIFLLSTLFFIKIVFATEKVESRINNFKKELHLPPPSNDEPCNATPLTVNTTCSYVNGTNALATASAGVPAPGCAGYSGGDVWFTAIVPASGNLYITTQANVMTDGGMAIYSGTCNNLTLIKCDDDGSPNGSGGGNGNDNGNGNGNDQGKGNGIGNRLGECDGNGKGIGKGKGKGTSNGNGHCHCHCHCHCHHHYQ